MRPNITWFGEIPMHMDKIYKLAEEADLFISIGTSGSVYPAAGFVSLFNEMGKPTIELNLEPSANIHQFTYSIHNKPATIAVEELKNILIKNNTYFFLINTDVTKTTINKDQLRGFNSKA